MVLLDETPTEAPAGIPLETPAEVPVKRRSRAWLYGILIVIVILAIGAVWFLRFNTSTPVLAIYPSQRLTSADWSGYTVSTDLQSPQAAVTSVTGSWTIPDISASAGDSFSAAWIGVSGQYDETLIQTGTEHDWVNGAAIYMVWYELLPQNPVQINMKVSPGDVMTGSITLQDVATQTWIVEISDASNGQTFRRSLSYATTRLSADWIVERPSVNNRISTLADFGKIAFTECSATLSRKTGSITGFPHSEFTLLGRMNNNLVTVSDTLQGGASFTVDFVAQR
jgi:hypothetical protein